MSRGVLGFVSFEGHGVYHIGKPQKWYSLKQSWVYTWLINMCLSISSHK